MESRYPDGGYTSLYVPFGGLDQAILRLRDELIDNPRELVTLSEYCTALRAKGDTWIATDCFQWSLSLVRTGQYDKHSGRWEQPNTEGELATLGTIVTSLKINYGETLLRAGLVAEALAAFESAGKRVCVTSSTCMGETKNIPDGGFDQPLSADLTMALLALGHAKDLTATHTAASATEYVELIAKQGDGARTTWRLHHSPEWYIWMPVLAACRWVFGTGLALILMLRAVGVRPWVQWPCCSLSNNFAVCCEWGGPCTCCTRGCW